MFQRRCLGSIVLGLLFTATPHLLHAQSAKSRLQLFQGGNIDGLIGIRSTLLTGAGVEGASGGFTTPLAPEPFVVFGNPAALGRIEDRTIGFASAPTVGLNLTNFQDPAPRVEEEVDKMTKNFKLETTKVYPEVKGMAEREGALLTGFAASFPLDDSDEDWFDGRIPRLLDRVAIGYHQPLVLHVNMIYSGLRMRIRTKEEKTEDEITTFMSISMNGDVRLTSHAWTIAGARQTGDIWWGAALQRTDIVMQLYAHRQTEGITSKARNESAFNDERDPWENDYYSSANGAFDGSANALRLGMIYEGFDNWLLGGSLKLQSDAKLEGNLDLQHYRFPPLNMNAQGDEEQFDPTKISDPAEMTRTYPKEFLPASTMTAHIPSELAIAAQSDGFMKPGITLRKYFGELSYEYEVIEEGTPHLYKRGFKPNWSVQASLDIFIFDAGLGYVQAVDVISGYKDASGAPIKGNIPLGIPLLALTFDMELTDRMVLKTLLMGLPEDALRLTLVHTF
ncbi:MAG: hypothetical protein FJY67_05515 [Calditrichaeota bacterium]|nr:hypothetical protein [Calditrichota bacterium]